VASRCYEAVDLLAGSARRSARRRGLSPGSHSCDLRVVRCQATALGATTLVGGPGNDDLFGQAGKDNLLAKNAGTDRLNGGTGRDSGSWNKKDQAKSVEKRLR
jgi:Ca2+-binding RTX toxin-like protein